MQWEGVLYLLIQQYFSKDSVVRYAWKERGAEALNLPLGCSHAVLLPCGVSGGKRTVYVWHYF